MSPRLVPRVCKNCILVSVMVTTTLLSTIAKTEPYEQSLKCHHNISYNSSSKVNSGKGKCINHDHATIPIKLNKCTIFQSSSHKVRIPTWYARDYTYKEAEYELGETLAHCATGHKPNATGVWSISQKSFTNYLNVSAMDDLDDINALLQNDVFLFDSGYLSVGSNDTALYFSPDEFCVADIQEMEGDTVAEFRTCDFDKLRPVYPKCCPLGTVPDKDFSGCDIPDVDFDGPDFLDKKTRKLVKFKTANPIYKHTKMVCNTVLEIWEFDNCMTSFYPATDNTAAFAGPRRWNFLEANVSKCYDRIAHEDGTRTPVMIHCFMNSLIRFKSNLRRPILHVRNIPIENESQTKISIIFMVMSCIAAGFYLLTTLVYLVTWMKQNIHGKTLCSCTASFFFMEMISATTNLMAIGASGPHNRHEHGRNHHEQYLCVAKSIGGQYFMTAAFSWLLVVNVDLFRTFRSFRADGNKSLRWFLAYSIFGWGFPLFSTVISITGIIIKYNSACRGLKDVDFVGYYCFLSAWYGEYYVYYVLSVLIGLSYVFAALTFFRLYGFKKAASTLRSNKEAVDRQNILLFLKLGALMGLQWILEVISWAVSNEDNQNSILWIIIDLYNALSAMLIFVIFVCKRTTLHLLEDTFPWFKELVSSISKFASNFKGDPTSADIVDTRTGTETHRHQLVQRQ